MPYINFFLNQPWDLSFDVSLLLDRILHACKPVHLPCQVGSVVACWCLLPVTKVATHGGHTPLPLLIDLKPIQAYHLCITTVIAV